MAVAQAARNNPSTEAARLTNFAMHHFGAALQGDISLERAASDVMEQIKSALLVAQTR